MSRLRPLVLLIDDDPDLALVLQAWLEPVYELEAIAEERGLLAKMRARRPDAVILDVGLPGRDGYRLCRILQRRYSRLPVLFLSGTDGEETFLGRLPKTPTGFLRKPADPERIHEHLRKLLYGWGLPGGLR